MVKYTLNYFDGRGRAEAIRMILAAAGKAFEDKRMSFEDWPAFKPKTPSGTLPVLEVDGQMISESVAIGRYVAKETGLAGKNNIQQAQADGVVDAMTDIRESMIVVFFEKDDAKKPEQIKTLEEKATKILATVERKLQANQGGKKFIVGDKMTWADITFLCIIQQVKMLLPDILAATPDLRALETRVAEQKNIAKYMKERHETQF